MTSRRKHVFALTAAFLFTLCLPFAASAQNNPWWRGGNNDGRRNDDYYGRDGRYDNYDRQSVRYVANRLKNNSKDFEKRVDRYLDHSRYNGSDREDRINDLAREFRDAAENFKDRVGDGRNVNRGSGEAQRMLQLGSRIERFMSRGNIDSRLWSGWSQIRQDLRTVGDWYGYRGGSNNGGYNGGYDPRRQTRNAPWGLPRN
ncbi:MAG TPA: hypothetical protein VM870_02955 [Pyrinomonadaceae bacterium]|jgi:hypothetical protein|nr:hypothetical protein [Pyrinomonadaceae bacterium]